MILCALILFAARIWHWEAEQAAVSWEGAARSLKSGGGGVCMWGWSRQTLAVSLSGNSLINTLEAAEKALLNQILKKVLNSADNSLFEHRIMQNESNGK